MEVMTQQNSSDFNVILKINLILTPITSYM